MTSNALVVLVGVALCVCSPLSGGLAAPPPAPNKLLFDIASNKNICDVKNVIVESPYVRSCDEAKLPSDDRRLSVDDPKQFLCLAIYDRIATLCYLDSLTTKGNSVLPDKTSDFDARVANLTPSDPSKSWAFCEKPKNPYPPRNQNTTRYAMQLNTAMANPVLCVKMCTYSDGSFNPLCSVIVAIEDISLGIAVPSEKTPKHEAEEKAKTVEKERTEKAEEPIEQSTVDKPKEVTSKTVDKTKGTQPQTSIDKKEAEQLAKHSKSPAQTQPQHSAPASEITKPAVVPSPAPSIQTPQNVKEKKIKTPETAAQPPKQETDNIVSDKKTDAQPSLPKNPPLDPDNVPIAGEEALEGYLRGIGNVVPSPDDPESEVISEHTEGQEGQGNTMKYLQNKCTSCTICYSP